MDQSRATELRLWQLPDDARLSREAASQVLTEAGFPTTKQTLARWACEGGGPCFELYGRKPIYPVGLLRTWIRERLGAPRANTSSRPSAPASQKEAGR